MIHGDLEQKLNIFGEQSPVTTFFDKLCTAKSWFKLRVLVLNNKG